MKKSAGFTLLEVLVAVAVLALALAAISKSAAGFISNQSYLRDRTYAQWIARNQLVETLLSKDWPSIGQKKDTLEYPKGDHREWRWQMQVTQTGEKDLRRLDIEVFPQKDFDKDDSPLATLSGFMRRP